MSSITGFRVGVGLVLGILVAGVGVVSADGANTSYLTHVRPEVIRSGTVAEPPRLPFGGRKIFPGQTLARSARISATYRSSMS